MKKRILSILIALCMVVCLVPTTVFAATQTADSWSGLQSLMNGTGDLSVTLSNDISSVSYTHLIQILEGHIHDFLCFSVCSEFTVFRGLELFTPKLA